MQATPHWWVFLDDTHVDGINSRITAKDTLPDAPSHMFQQARRLTHLLSDYIKQDGIVECVVNIVSFACFNNIIIMYAHVDNKPATNPAFLFHDTVEGIEPDVTQENNAICTLHHTASSC